MPMHVQDLQAARRQWWLFLGLGALLIVLGLLALTAMPVVALATTIYFGFLLLFDGIFHLGSAFWSRTIGGLFLSLLVGVLDGIIGLVMIVRPMRSAEALTAVLGMLFLFGGVFRAVGAATIQYPRWGLSVLSGLVSVVLGVCILLQWSEGDVFWIIGLFVGIELLSRGLSWVITSLALRHVGDTAADRA
jgi:uncharacterized membrane protein HdeD (DUF308 family)